MLWNIDKASHPRISLQQNDTVCHVIMFTKEPESAKNQNL